MKTILVANAKGGAGKTTLATNIAGGLAARGAAVTLWDLDRQKSALQWLAVRADSFPGIARLGDGRDDVPKGKGWLIMDSPAGLHGKTLARALKLSHRVMVPVQPSLFDMAATSDFLRDLVAAFEERGGAAGRIGIVGMRVDPRTRAAATLEAFLGQFGLPVLTYLRDTQLYANAAFSGASLFDLPAYLSARELAQWDPVFEWLST
jgi:chromosome partitioning protein